MKNDEVTIEIQCTDLPGNTFDGRASIRVGMQRGKEVVQDVPGDVAGAVMTATVQLKEGRESGTVRLAGPFVHGTADDPFLYLSWGQRIAETWQMFRRAKIKLGHLSAATLRRAAEEGTPLRVALSLTDSRGGPVCGTVKPDRLTWS